MVRSLKKSSQKISPACFDNGHGLLLISATTSKLEAVPKLCSEFKFSIEI
jgi:hypothetical protein